VNAKTLALEALAGDLPVAADPRPSRRSRYRLLATARENDCAVVAVVSFSSSGLIVTYGDFKLELGQWQWVGGAGRDLDWDEIPPLSEGQSPTTLLRSHGGFGFPAWSHVRVPEDIAVASTSRQGSEPSNGHVIRFD
jgi:hypothetical protein